MSLSAITEKNVAGSHLEELDEQRDLLGAALEGRDWSAAAAHLDSIVYYARRSAKALRKLDAIEAAQ